VILVIASPEDTLATQFGSHCVEPIRRSSEADLFSAPFSLEIDHHTVRGSLSVHGEKVSLADLSAIFLRPSRTWWPGPEFAAQDQMFVYHETIASWFTFFDCAACPVINRFGLGWWLQDHSYPMQLRSELAAILGVPASDCAQPPSAFTKLTPTGPDPEARSVYLAGQLIIGTAIVTTGHPLDIAIRSRMSAIREWQNRTGISFCRLDFETGAVPRLKSVEVFPLLDREPARLIDRVAAALMEEIR